MATLTSNDEQAVCGGDGLTAEELAEIDEGKEDIVANKKDFFHEIDEVREALKTATSEDLPHAQCRVSCERIGQIWSQYQEQPALLDPFLEEMVEPLMCAIAAKVRRNDLDNPNLHLLSSLMYLLTTVRGYKTVVRLFPHEAADLEPCLEAAEEEAKKEKQETWSTLYCLTLWLGMVLLTPFDLSTIDSGHESSNSLSTRIYNLALEGLKSTSRTRDASAWMLAKFFGRPDVSNTGLLQSFLAWTRNVWMDSTISITAQVFVKSGVLQAWNQTLKLAPRSVMSGLWTQVLRLVLDGPSGAADSDFGALSNLRKMRVSVACRAAMVILPPRLAPWRYERGARSLLVNFAQATGSENAKTLAVGANTTLAEEEEDEEEAPEEIEEVVELLLTSLSDKDTIVRWAAAKAVGRITNRLSRDFGDQVLESLLERCFSFRESDKAWHGGCLALAELTRRGLLLPERLGTVMPLVCRALHFEEVSGNHTLGQHVRDAACYVCWAFARAFPPDVLQPFVMDLASALIQVAVFDREINCRRAAAAAVQENVGRQGTFPDGIEVVTIADYWSLSGRRHAYLEVAPQIATLGEGGYRKALMEHLVDRKLAHQDMQIRLLAAQGLAKLAQEPSEETLDFLNSTVLPKLLLRANDSGGSNATSNGGPTSGGTPVTGTVQARHGAVEGAAALTEVLKDKVSAENQTQIRNLVPALEKARAYRGRGGEVIRQAACRLLGRIADTTWTFKDATAARYLQTLDECARHTTESIQVAAAEALKVLAAKRFKEDLVMKCVDNYLQGLQKSDETIAARRGFALSLGALGSRNLRMRREEVLRALRREALGEQLPGGKDQDDPTTRQYAVLSLGCLCIGVDLSSSEVSIFLSALEGAMQDYATDRRGDVGSWVREVAMEVLAALLQQQRLAGLPRLADAETSTKLMALLLQQGVEKIDRLRERAYGLLRMLCHGHTDGMHYAYRRVLHGEAYDAVSLAVSSAVGQSAASASSTWPPAEIEVISKCLETSRIETTPMAEPTKADLQADRNAAVFDALAPLIGTATYRSALLKGIVVSVGGITEHTAKDAKRALLRQVFHSDTARHEVCSDLLLFCERINVKDSDSEAKRFLAPLMNTLGILMAQDAVPPEFARKMLQCTVAAVQQSRDVTRLRSSINVFVGLMRWLEVRCESLEMLLQFLGYSFPTVRQATAQALYIRFLEEEGHLDLSKAPEAPHLVSSEDLHSISELLSLTPWATDETETLQVALKDIYEKLKLELPQGGRSILVPKKVAAGEQRREAQYADLVRENHF